MTELDPFDVRLATVVRSMADRADTRVDAVAVATEAIGHRGIGPLLWSLRRLPVAVSFLLLLALSLALFGLSALVGALRSQPALVAPVPAPSATGLSAPIATPLPTTDGVGDEYVTGTGTFSIQEHGTSVQVGDVTQVRGFVAVGADVMNDPRVSGTGTIRLDIDSSGSVGGEWGTYRLEAAEGAWEGTVSGGAWDAGNTSDVSGYLVGSGAYAGFTYYVHFRSSFMTNEIDGIIYLGSPPGP